MLTDWQDTVRQTITAMRTNGVDHVVTVTYPDTADRASTSARDRGQRLIERRSSLDRLNELIADVVAQAGVTIGDSLLVTVGRWRSCDCQDVACCPTDGTLLPVGTSSFQAAAVVAGHSVAATRTALADRLTPDPRRDRLAARIARYEQAETAAVLDGRQDTHRRAAARALFSAARASTQPCWTPPSDDAAARFGVALRSTTVRDAVWLAVDSGRLDGQPLWLELARRLPDPHRAGPAFLDGWRAWRAGDGATARIAADHALAADSDYGAARLLLVALDRGINPSAVPRLTREGEARLTH